ncbi:hypothetical protein ABZP36_010829 [Zizania latifolia]
MVYYGVGTNLVNYLTKTQGQSNVTAATNIASWQGTCYLTPLLGAFLADSYWGRHRTNVVSLTGMVVLTLSAVVPPNMQTPVVIFPQEAISSLGLCVPTFGADQFDDTDGSEMAQKELFYSWYYFAVNGGFFVTSTVAGASVGSGQLWLGTGFWDPYIVFSHWLCRIPSKYKSLQVPETRRKRAYDDLPGCGGRLAAFRKIDVDVPSESSLLCEMPGKESAFVGSRKLMHTDGLGYYTTHPVNSFH